MGELTRSALVGLTDAYESMDALAIDVDDDDDVNSTMVRDTMRRQPFAAYPLTLSERNSPPLEILEEFYGDCMTGVRDTVLVSEAYSRAAAEIRGASLLTYCDGSVYTVNPQNPPIQLLNILARKVGVSVFTRRRVGSRLPYPAVLLVRTPGGSATPHAIANSMAAPNSGLSYALADAPEGALKAYRVDAPGTYVLHGVPDLIVTVIGTLHDLGAIVRYRNTARMASAPPLPGSHSGLLSDLVSSAVRNSRAAARRPATEYGLDDPEEDEEDDGVASFLSSCRPGDIIDVSNSTTTTTYEYVRHSRRSLWVRTQGNRHGVRLSLASVERIGLSPASATREYGDDNPALTALRPSMATLQSGLVVPVSALNVGRFLRTRPAPATDAPAELRYVNSVSAKTRATLLGDVTAVRLMLDRIDAESDLNAWMTDYAALRSIQEHYGVRMEVVPEANYRELLDLVAKVHKEATSHMDSITDAMNTLQTENQRLHNALDEAHKDLTALRSDHRPTRTYVRRPD